MCLSARALPVSEFPTGADVDVGALSRAVDVVRKMLKVPSPGKQMEEINGAS
jgi:hypothetical protein